MEKEIILKTKTGSLCGTLLTPDDSSPKEIVALFICGSGPTLVLLAGCGRPADEVLKEQLSEQWAMIIEQSGITKDTIFSFLDMLKRGEAILEVPQALYSLFRPSVQPYMISWFAVDPVVEIKKVTVPILIVQGDKDIQISIKDAELLHQSSKNSTKIIIPNMNHVLKRCETMDKEVQMPLYSNPTLKNVPQLSECVIEFINRI